jgi:pilus assembly protein CpaF
MSLKDRLRRPLTVGSTETTGRPDVLQRQQAQLTAHVSKSFIEIKQNCQRIAAEDEAFYRSDSEETRSELTPRIETLVRETAQDYGYPLADSEVRQLGQELLDEIYGLGPLEVLLSDPMVADILVNGHDQIYVERNGMLELTDIKFISEEHLRNKVDRMLFGTGRRVDEASPLVDSRLPDGSRINIIVPPLALNGIVISIRRFPEKRLRATDLIKFGSITQDMYEFLQASVLSGLNIIVSGGTGSGKTTMLNMLSGFIPANERIVTIEDSAELQLQQDHVVRLESRPANAEGSGSISQGDLLINALRMRPDRIVLGEVRGAEVLDMLAAMNTGHDGSLATIHANTPRDCISRLDLMVNLSGVTLPDYAIKRQIVSAVDLIIQVGRGRDGKRRTTSITEVTGIEKETVVLQELFRFDPNPHKEGHGSFVGSGIRPLCDDKFKLNNITLREEIFHCNKEV